MHNIFAFNVKNLFNDFKESFLLALQQVVQFLLLLLRRFKDFDQAGHGFQLDFPKAFTFIDGAHGNGVINLKEMTERVQRMGYREFQGLFKRIKSYLDAESRCSKYPFDPKALPLLRSGQQWQHLSQGAHKITQVEL